jgi:hypothetical protein
MGRSNQKAIEKLIQLTLCFLILTTTHKKFLIYYLQIIDNFSHIILTQIILPRQFKKNFNKRRLIKI